MAGGRDSLLIRLGVEPRIFDAYAVRDYFAPRAYVTIWPRHFLRGLGGRHGSLGDGNSSAGDCDGVLGTGANEIASEVGRVDRRRVPAGDWEGARDLPAAVWNIGETWAALAVGNGLVERAVCDGACGAAGVRGDIPRLLFWTDCGSTA